NWLKDFVTLTDKPAKLAQELTLKTCEIEDIIDEQSLIAGFVVGKVLKKDKHPGADRLSVAEVDYGQGPVTVVCGAPNLEVDQMIVFAPVGLTVATGLKLEKIKIRGVESNGMICAEDEIGLSDNHDEIMVLDGDKAKVGMTLIEYFKKDDIIFEVDNKSITHRPDLFSHLGVAREISAIKGKKFVEPKLQEIKEAKQDSLKVTIKDSNKCARYMGVILDEVKIGPSPEFIQKRLEVAGMRSISNVVDIANYVMLEYGQPLHTFDYNAVSSGQDQKHIIVREAQKSEKLLTLDNQERELEKTDLVIADEQGVIALAGVMGGAESEVKEGSSKIILESANFDGPTVRRTSWRLGLRSEAVLRFEKGLPRELPALGLKRAVALFEKYAGAKVTSQVIDSYPKPVKSKTIELEIDYITRLLGVNISKAEARRYLTLLGFDVKESGQSFKVEVPWYREGIELPEELIEEIGRLYGGDKIVPAIFQVPAIPTPKDALLSLSRDVKQTLYAQSLDELVTYSFYGAKMAQKCDLPLEEHLEIQNPFSKDAALMRTSLLPILLEKLAQNLPNFNQPQFFEVGHVYGLENESQEVTGLIFGSKEDVFYQAKGISEAILSQLKINYRSRAPEGKDVCVGCELDRALVYEVKKQVLGSVVLVSSKVLKNFSIKKGYVATFTFKLEALLKVRQTDQDYEPLPKFPEARVDLAFVLKNDIPVKKIDSAMREVGKPLVEKIEVFDIYRGKPLESDEKSLAFHITYRSPGRTLTDKEVKGIRQKTEDKLKSAFDAHIRDF
ncbi:phenylalanine--tRNA ligase subunit beta, partial [Patescibacteria group bacterium]|nr:phenylalanine--tRNA ligase subunit beta [Patescibacteria group bacterium]